jgi:ParB/Sulfiredoxin domain
MEGAEFDELIADVKAHGLREPIVLYEGKILDGRNRYRACLKLGIDPKGMDHHDGCAAIGDPAAYVISKNIHRCHQSGLVDAIGQDAVQRLMRNAFHRVRDPS